MPLMPATRPLATNNSDAAMPIRIPPANDESSVGPVMATALDRMRRPGKRRRSHSDGPGGMRLSTMHAAQTTGDHDTTPASSRAPTAHWTPWVAVASFVLITAIIGHRTWQRLEVPGQPELPLYGMQDFRDTIYYPVHTLLLGDNPYSPSATRRHHAPGSVFPLYTPIHFAVHLPYGFLSQRTAELVHFVLVTMLTVAIGFACLRLCHVPTTITNVFGFATFLLASKAGYQGLFFGQVATYLVLATYAALRFARTQPWLAGACLALTCLKPTFGLPLAVMLLASGAFTAVAIGAVLATATSFLMGAFVWRAAGGWQSLLAALRENVASWSNLPEARGGTGISSVDTVALLDRWWNLPAALEVVVSATVLTLGAVAVARAASSRRRCSRGASRSSRFSRSRITSSTTSCSWHCRSWRSRVDACRSGPTPSGQACAGACSALLTVAAFNHFSSYEILDGVRDRRHAAHRDRQHDRHRSHDRDGRAWSVCVAPRDAIDFVAEVPRNPSGKLLKREIRAPYWEGRARRV